MPGLGIPDDALVADDHRLGLVGRLDHADRALGSGGDRRGRGLDRGALGHQRIELFRVDVVHDQGKAGLQQVARHRLAHVAKTDEPDFPGHRASSVAAVS